MPLQWALMKLSNVWSLNSLRWALTFDVQTYQLTSVLTQSRRDVYLPRIFKTLRRNTSGNYRERNRETVFVIDDVRLPKLLVGEWWSPNLKLHYVTQYYIYMYTSHTCRSRVTWEPRTVKWKWIDNIVHRYFVHTHKWTSSSSPIYRRHCRNLIEMI